MPTNGQTDARRLRGRLPHPDHRRRRPLDRVHPGHARGVPAHRRRGGGRGAGHRQPARAQRARDAVAERARKRVGMEAFWSSPSENVLDRATAMFPRLLYDRLDDLGIDFSVVYPTAGLGFHRMQDTRQRRAICRAYNVFTADQFRRSPTGSSRRRSSRCTRRRRPSRSWSSRSRQLGYRVVMVGGLMRRPVPALAEEHPEASKHVEWYDVIGIDSPHDYDPVWAKCRELRVAPSFHNGARSILLRNSPSNFCYNHIGHFASAGHAVAKAIFLGGVTRRFPDLNFAFLEGGVGWACMLYADLVGHWEKRNRQAIEHTNPNRLDRARLLEFARKYGQRRGRRGGEPGRRPGRRLELEAHRRPRGPRRLLPLPDPDEGGHPGPVRPALLLRLRGRRSRSTRGPSTAARTRWALASTRSSARTSGTSTSRT